MRARSRLKKEKGRPEAWSTEVRRREGQRQREREREREMWRRAASRLQWPSKPSLDRLVHQAREGMSSSPVKRSPFITFVLGGPGSGKGTQCVKMSETFGFTHLSAGDLLRQEMSSGSENGAMICDTIKEGKIVPSEITINLIKKAIESSKNSKFLIDGFPRSDENRIAFERIVGAEPDIVLFFDCPKEEMVKRVLSRNQGRIDDNINTVKKRLKVFDELNIPVIDYYTAKGKVCKINAVGTVDEIFEKVWPLFASSRC